MRISINKKSLLKAVLKIHRLLGFFLCLLFVIWCLSGFVMMYKGFPAVTKQDKLRLLRPIDLTKVHYPAHLEKIIQMNDIQTIRLTTVNQQPVFCIETKDDQVFNVTSDQIAKKITYTKEDAKAIIDNFYGKTVAIKSNEAIHEVDQWIPRDRFQKHMPIYRVSIANSEGTVWYISSKTGEVLQKLNYSDKVWAWFGAIPHWLYFKDIRINTPLWRGIVIAFSFIGVILSVAGIILGVHRFRIARKRKLWLTPYKKKWFKWHHYLGFIFGTFTFTWVLSGLFSMNPLKWSPEDQLSENERLIWEGKETLKNEFNEANFNAFIQRLPNNKAIYTIDFKSFNSKLVADLTHVNERHTSTFFAPKQRKHIAPKITDYRTQVNVTFPGRRITGMSQLKKYDDYYYSRTNDLPLPVFKYELNDVGKTALYINPINHQVIKKVEQKNRLERWIYHGLHSFDFAALRDKRPLWDVTVIFFLTGVTLLSLTGAVLTYKKLFWRR